jgi:uncharacterized repeat protein (TIGR03803 family)
MPSIKASAIPGLRAALACTLLLAVAATRISAKAVRFEVLHSFDNAVEGTSPSAVIEAVDGQLYGLASSGGAYGEGTFFRMTRDGAVTVLHHFSSALDGVANPRGLVQGGDGSFYGLTSRAVFQVTPLGTVRILYTFASFEGPSNLLPAPDGNLYGTTGFVNTNETGGGRVFKLTPTGLLTNLRSFLGGTSRPRGLILGSDGDIYGTTLVGEANPVRGDTVYRMTLDGVVRWEQTVFDPGELAEGADGNFYGFRCCSGVSGEDFIYRVTPYGTVQVVRERRAWATGNVSFKRARDGQFYGTVFHPIYHAIAPTTYSSSIFKMTIDGTITILQDSPEGQPILDHLIQAIDGTFYGTESPNNDRSGSGAVFAMKTIVTPTPAGDFDGDARSDLTVFRPMTGVWYVLQSSAGFGNAVAMSWGLPTDVPVPGDYDGDGRIDPAMYRPATGMWYVLTSSSNYTNYIAEPWGVSTDSPVPGDYDGDGRDDLAVYRSSTGVWFIKLSAQNYTTNVSYQWGLSTDVPVPGDYDGDGRADLGVYRPATGMWYILRSSHNYTTYMAQPWGSSTDVPVPGDYDGDGKVDFGVYRPSTGVWWVLLSSTNFTTVLSAPWGIETDTPVPGDYDGDGKADLAVFRPSTGDWYILQSSTHFTTYVAQHWGVSTDIPILTHP